MYNTTLIRNVASHGTQTEHGLSIIFEGFHGKKKKPFSKKKNRWMTQKLYNDSRRPPLIYDITE